MEKKPTKEVVPVAPKAKAGAKPIAPSFPNASSRRANTSVRTSAIRKVRAGY